MEIKQQIRYKIGDNDSYAYVFTDEELDNIISINTGSSDEETVLLSSVFCVKAMLADSAKRFNYRQDNSSVNASEIFDHLKDLLADLLVDLEVLQTNAGEDGGATVLDRYNTDQELNYNLIDESPGAY